MSPSGGVGVGASGGVPAVPLERGRALGILVGMGAFCAGFAVAAALVTVSSDGAPPYLIAVTVGFLGVGVIGFFLNRGTVPLPEARIWSPAGLRSVAFALDLPAMPVTVTLYVLAAVGILGNLVVPLLARGR